MDEKKLKNTAEMSDEEFLEYINSLGAAADDEEEVIDEGAEGETAADNDVEAEGTEEAIEESGTEEEGASESEITEAEKDTPADSASGKLLSYARSKFPEAASDDEAASMLLASLDTREEPAGEPMPADGGAPGAVEARPGGDTDRIMSEWRAQEKALKGIVPNFNLQQAFANPQFKKLVVEQGMDVIDAYRAMNPQKEAEGPALDEIGRSASGAAAGTASQDISKVSDEEFDKYIKRIMDEE